MLTRRCLVTAICAAPLVPNLSFASATTLTAKDAYARMQAGELILIDVRTPQEWQDSGVADGAWPLDLREEGFGIWIAAALERNPDHQIAIICRSGNRSGRLMQMFAQNGIEGVLDVSEGMLGGPHGKGWISSGLPIVSAAEAYGSMPKDLTAN